MDEATTKCLTPGTYFRVHRLEVPEHTQKSTTGQRMSIPNAAPRRALRLPTISWDCKLGRLGSDLVSKIQEDMDSDPQHPHKENLSSNSGSKEVETGGFLATQYCGISELSVLEEPCLETNK